MQGFCQVGNRKESESICHSELSVGQESTKEDVVGNVARDVWVFVRVLRSFFRIGGSCDGGSCCGEDAEVKSKLDALNRLGPEADPEVAHWVVLVTDVVGVVFIFVDGKRACHGSLNATNADSSVDTELSGIRERTVIDKDSHPAGFTLCGVCLLTELDIHPRSWNAKPTQADNDAGLL